MKSQNAPEYDAQTTRLLIADNLSAEVKRARWSGRKMADALGLTQPYVARRLSGDTECSGSDLALFAGFLNVPVAAFFAARPMAEVAELDTTRNAERQPLDYRTDGSLAPVTHLRSREAVRARVSS